MTTGSRPNEEPGLLHRLAEHDREPVTFMIDGRPAQALAGDTLLTAVLTNFARLRVDRFEGEPRAGFCLMGACQDCWLRLADGTRMRACTSFVEPGMSVSTTAEPWQVREDG